MYCPKCATQNTDDTKYCRSCGSNLSLVPQALTGRLPETPSGRRRHRSRGRDRDDGPPTLANGITQAFMGVGFLLVSAGAFLFAPAGRIWWFWMLIPSFIFLGKGIGEIATVMQAKGLTPGTNQTTIPAAQPGELPPRGDAFLPPTSVTEHTTRQLDPTTDPYRYRDRDAH
jgi:hypothetical protein